MTNCFYENITRNMHVSVHSQKYNTQCRYISFQCEEETILQFLMSLVLHQIRKKSMKCFQVVKELFKKDFLRMCLRCQKEVYVELR